MSAAGAPRPEPSAALSSYRTALIGVGLVSGMINVLYLTGSLFMLEVYDRVIPSRSVPTLVGLALLTATLFAFQGVLDMLRARIFVRLGKALDEQLGRRVYRAIVSHRLQGRGAEATQPLRDLDQVRGFLSSNGPGALFDLPWLPLYLAICFAFHFLIGAAALGGAIVLVTLTFATEVLTKRPSREATRALALRTTLAETSRRNAESLVALGMAPAIGARWAAANDAYGLAQQRSADIAGDLGAVAKTLRMMLQSAVLGVGAYLVIHGEASAGIIIASSILTARALAPVDQAIAHWKHFVAARQAWSRLRTALAAMPVEAEPLPLPAPAAGLSIEALSVAAPWSERLIVREVSFALKAGDALAVVGPSGSGKSSLARALVGIWKPVRGAVRLDRAALDQWSPDALGRHIGYLPQDIELFDGTVADNIARFAAAPDPAAIVAAAKAAGVHDLVLALPDGYGTRIGEGGLSLSGGQRQRVALARALFGEPFLVVLDEPNSNLDLEGERALSEAIRSVRARGGIVVVVSHRANALANVDLVMLLIDGRVQGLGPKTQALRPVETSADGERRAAS